LTGGSSHCDTVFAPWTYQRAQPAPGYHFLEMLLAKKHIFSKLKTQNRLASKKSSFFFAAQNKKSRPGGGRYMLLLAPPAQSRSISQKKFVIMFLNHLASIAELMYGIRTLTRVKMRLLSGMARKIPPRLGGFSENLSKIS